jgi:hypothetical protein
MMKKLVFATAVSILLLPATTFAADKKLKGAVYTPSAGVICDKKAGFCADSEGISMGFTKEYLGQAAQDKMMKLINDVGVSNFDTTWFVLSNGVACKTKEKACTVSKIDNKIDTAHTKALFGTLPKK